MPRVFHIIAIAGPKGSGKSTLADKLAESYTASGFYVQRASFAHPLKKLAVRLGWDGAKDKRGRKILQYLGTEVCRTISDTYWVDKMETFIHKTKMKSADLNRNTVVIIDDARFINEAERIRSLGGKIVQLTPSLFTRHWWRALAGSVAHSSERLLPYKLLDAKLPVVHNNDDVTAAQVKSVRELVSKG